MNAPTHPGREHDLTGHRGACNCPVCFAYAKAAFDRPARGGDPR